MFLFVVRSCRRCTCPYDTGVSVCYSPRRCPAVPGRGGCTHAMHGRSRMTMQHVLFAFIDGVVRLF